MSRTRPLVARAAALMAAFALAIVGLTGIGTAPATAQTVVDSGHVDVFEPHVENGRINLYLKMPDGKLVDPGSVRLVLKGGEFGKGGSWLDKAAQIPGVGAPAAVIPQTQDPAILWAGWDILALGHGGYKAADIVFDRVEGPAPVRIGINANLGGGMSPLVETKKDSQDFTLNSGDVVKETYLSHKHFNWFFVKPGDYRITAHIVAYGRDGQTGRSDAKTVTLTVQPKFPDKASNEDESEAQARPNADGAKTNQGESQKPARPNADNGQVVAQTDTQGQRQADQAGQQNRTELPAPRLRASASSSGTEKCLPTTIRVRISAETARKRGLLGGAGAPAARPAPAAGGGQVLTPVIKDDRSAPARMVSPSSLTFGISERAHIAIPQAVRGRFGLPERGYLIGATQVAGVPWVGANTMNPSVEQQVVGGVTWRLDAVSGPGRMVVFESGNMGQAVGTVWFARPGDTHALPLMTHVHPNWIFTQAGTYKVRVTQTARLKSGQAVSGTATLTFIAGGQGNANQGHFDIGAEIGVGPAQLGGAWHEGGANHGVGPNIVRNADGTYTVTRVVGRTPSGKPCSLDGSLAQTGVNSLTVPLLVLAAGLALAAVGGAALRSQTRA